MEVPDEILNKYLERRKNDLRICHESLEQKNLKELAKVGHQLKGNGITFGYQELSAIGKELEDAANAKSLSHLKKALKDFSDWVSEHQPN